ncbi:MAG: hypothetical protein QOJ25_888 [Solirubrobacteraceae bacterium]|jgi:hypothetical protein|nr:hypothetical protein [Solirubrobacteraceae bacterium]
MEGEVERRIAANEARFRRVNEAISRGQWPGEADESVGFRCECGTLGCSGLLELTSLEYQRIRTNPRRFVVLPGHQHEDVEKVVETRPTYLVVEKTDEAGEVAEATDPRE